MDCYFHANVPSIAPCADCAKPICATCRDERGTCPSCRLAQKMDDATASRASLGGQVPPRPEYQQQYQQHYQQQYQQAPPPAAQPRATVATLDDPIETRALIALGYPLWPLALLGLFDRKKSRYLKKQALQALGFNVGFAAFYGLMSLAGNIPFLGWSAGFIAMFMFPIFLVASVFFGIKVWQGDDVHVPIIGDWIDEKLPAA